MLKTATAVLAASAFTVSCLAAPVSDFARIDKAVAGIQTAAGIALKKRLAACKIVLHKDTSTIETLTAPAPQYGAKAGDTVLKLVLDFPPPPKQSGPSLPQPAQKNVQAIWIIDNGKAQPLSAWAIVLQNRPVPLGYDESNNC